MATAKERMAEASRLIKQKDYVGARRILKQINHPTAQQWLDKLDEVDPFGAIDEPQEAAAAKPVEKKKSGIAGCVKSLIFYLVVVPIGLGVAIVLLAPKGGSARPATFDSLRDRVQWVIANKTSIKLKGLTVRGNEILMSTQVDNISTQLDVQETHEKTVQAVCALRDDGVTGYDMIFMGEVKLVNALGEEWYDTGVQVVLKGDTIAEINCSNKSRVNVRIIADDYRLSPAVSSALNR
jgi:hypothetical protein